MSSEVHYNRVLLTDLGFFRRADTEGLWIFRDGSGLQYQIEELIASGAVEISVEASDMAVEFIKMLPPTLKKRTSIVDRRHKCLKRTQSLIAPIADELSLEIEHGAFRFGSKTPHDLGDAATTVYFNIHPFLLGIEHELQVEIDIERLISSIQMLREKLRSPASRATIVELEGILGTYKQNSVDSITIKSDASKEHVQLFKEFVEDQQYLRLSEEYYRLGLPDYMKRAVTLIGRLTRKLIKKPVFRETAGLSSKIVSTATKIPMPNSEMWEALLRKEYLPPIISLKRVMEKAERSWDKTRPNPVLPPGLDKKLL